MILLLNINYDYACVTKSLQLRVSLRFTAPRYDAYCKIWVYTITEMTFCLSRFKEKKLDSTG
jgi:hypothetical protein